MVTFKKYANRRLYDTDASRYVTLEEIAQRVRSGHDIRVVDDKTGEDLTQSVLVQILLESRKGSRLLPTPLLMQLIRLGDGALAEFFGRYLSLAFELYMRSRQGMGSLFPLDPRDLGGPALLSALTSGPLGSLWGTRSLSGESDRVSEPQVAVAAPPADDDLATLRRELEALRREVHAGAGAPKARRKAPVSRKRG